MFAVRQNKYCCVFRPDWIRLGNSERGLIPVVTSAGETEPKCASVHFRLVVDTTETDSGERFRYKVRFKIDTRQASTALANSVVNALRMVNAVRQDIPDENVFQKTVPLKSAEKLPGLSEEPGVPDDVTGWFARHVKELIPVLDAAFKAV